jgi:D-sedoheptulose 7-phosphate isomerase
LFIMVAESTEILRPITQLGCLQACSGVTSLRVAGSRSRGLLSAGSTSIGGLRQALVMQQWIAGYLEAQKRAVDSLNPVQLAGLVETLKVAHAADRQIFIAGNGGSAANASHFAVDLGKGASDKLARRFRVLSLTDNTAWITALGNDYSYDDVFVKQLMNYGRPGDVFIGVSVSGNSPNLVKAHEWAAANGLRTIALVGGKRGRMAELAEQVVVVGDTHYGRVEDVQMHVLHLLCYAFMENAGA